MQPTTPQNTKPDQNVKHGLAEACKSGEPLYRDDRVAQLVLTLKLRRTFAVKYKLHEQAFDVLMDITTRWLMENKASTVWSLVDFSFDGVTAMKHKVMRLKAKGLIEVAGLGKSRCMVYIPTKVALLEVKRIVDEVSAALQLS